MFSYKTAAADFTTITSLLQDLSEMVSFSNQLLKLRCSQTDVNSLLLFRVKPQVEASDEHSASTNDPGTEKVRQREAKSSKAKSLDAIVKTCAAFQPVSRESSDMKS